MRNLVIRAINALQRAAGIDGATLATGARVFAAIMTLVSLLLIVRSIRRMRLPAPARWTTPLLGLLTTLLASGAYWVLLEPPVNTALATPLLLAGVVLGLLQGLQSKLYREQGVLMVRRTTAYMGLWGFAFIATLALGQLQQAAFQAVGALTLALTLGIAVGANLSLGLRQATAR